MNKANPQNVVLDDEEKDLLESFERREWKSVENLEEEKDFAKKAAANYLRKNIHINVGQASLERGRAMLKISAHHRSKKTKLNTLRQAALQFEKLLVSYGVTEDELLAEFRALREGRKH